MSATSPDLADARSIELVIGGMTCASCAARIEKKLNNLEGSVRPSTTPLRRPR